MSLSSIVCQQPSAHELAGAAQGEGFAHAWAAKVFNPDDMTSTCSFNYYKPVLLDTCLTSASRCKALGPNRIMNIPPIGIDCNGGLLKWRNRDPGLRERVEQDESESTTGTEWDWMLFLRALEFQGATSILEQIYIYQDALKGGSPSVTFDGTRAQARDKSAVSLLESVAAVKGGTGQRGFIELGDAYGVSTDITPP